MKMWQEFDLLGDDSDEQLRAVLVLARPRMEPAFNIYQLIDAQVLATCLSKCAPYLDGVNLAFRMPLAVTIPIGALGLDGKQRVRCAVECVGQHRLLPEIAQQLNVVDHDMLLSAPSTR